MPAGGDSRRGHGAGGLAAVVDAGIGQALGELVVGAAAALLRLALDQHIAARLASAAAEGLAHGARAPGCSRAGWVGGVAG